MLLAQHALLALELMAVPLDLDELPLEVAYELIVLGAKLLASPPLPPHDQRMARHDEPHHQGHGQPHKDGEAHLVRVGVRVRVI